MPQTQSPAHISAPQNAWWAWFGAAGTREVQEQEGLEAQRAQGYEPTIPTSNSKSWFLSVPPAPWSAPWLFLLGQIPPGPPACPSTYQAGVDHWGLYRDCPHQVVPSLTLRNFLGPKHKHGKPTKKFPVLHRALSLTQKSRLYLIFRNRPPTIAARWMTCVGRTFSNRARVCAASLGEARPSEAPWRPEGRN